MNHLDEGTIHAWLDGGLNAAQSTEVDAHVKACAECSAKVAEARGLIAASSRILNALDDVPANVIPKRAPVVEATRRRSIAPWISGLAAAVVLVTLWRTGGVEQKPVAQITIPPIQTTPVLPEPSLERLKEPGPPVATRPRPRAEQPQSVAANQRAEIGRVAGAASGAGAASPAANDLASSAPAPAPVAAIAEVSRRDRAEPDSVAGCYPLVNKPETAVAAAAAESRVAERSARRPAAAPAAAVQKAMADEQVLVSSLRLDSAGVVRNAVTNQSIGRWTRVGPDSVRILIAGQVSVRATTDRKPCP